MRDFLITGLHGTDLGWVGSSCCSFLCEEFQSVGCCPLVRDPRDKAKKYSAAAAAAAAALGGLLLLVAAAA